MKDEKLARGKVNGEGGDGSKVPDRTIVDIGLCKYIVYLE
jgi:hypothetical protein